MMCAEEQALAARQLPAVPFYCPLAPAAHPGAGVLNDRTVAWMLRQNLDTDERQRSRLTLCDFGGLTAATMPYGTLEPLTLMAKFHAVLFSLDDGLCDETGASADLMAQETSRILRAVEAPAAHSGADSPHTASLRALRTELERYASPQQIRRWTESLRVYTSGLVWEASWRRSAGLPSLDDYVTLWMRAIGMAPSTAMIEIVGGFTVRDEELSDPRVQALTETAWTLVGWDNDLYSRNKELLRAGDDLNLIDVLCQELGCEPREAQVRAVAMRDRVMVLHSRLRAQVLADAGDELRAYVEGLGQFVRGHLDWASACPRYSAGAGPAARPGGWWKRHPSDAGTEPLPIPTISWWWEQLDTTRRTRGPAASTAVPVTAPRPRRREPLPHGTAR
ncbi:terpene synthase family protein [Streptomyces sp. NBC_01498]|uniref:terpene synthase family protein n=1 Tax=Streptomyces sp. NBC_01498 TaxID=2975870 RepID=UPI002E7B1271|nr:terpene synthase family protein [Streptomyces sp. NBC_01498]WTL23714.1 terpene synthase family protein [Streptomyces sp. NBC_01498]